MSNSKAIVHPQEGNAFSIRLEFKTVDAVTLKGDLYKAQSPTGNDPIVVMTQGVRIAAREKSCTY